MIEKVYYINLDRRTDRRKEIEDEFKKIGLEAIRYSAISHSNGAVGCSLSHLSILKEAKQKNLKNVLILEDDFMFLVSKEEFWNQIQSFFDMNLEWDVLMLSYNIKQSKPYNSLVQKVYNAQTTSGFIVNSCFYDKLIDVIEKSIPLLIQTGQHWKYAIDQAWKVLQGDTSNWYAFNRRIGKQRSGFSDLANRYISYEC